MTAYTLLWFDVEDYVEPQSDDALKGLIEAFEANGVQGTWKLVGEKARVLEQRGRTDIIRLLQRQDIGYHTDFHSRHPVLAEYLNQMGWEDGIRELVRREAPGYADLVRICGPASTFGQAGGSWAPQIAPLMRELDIPLFMDEASHLGLDGDPFWYCGVLHVNRLGDFCTRMQFTKGEEGLEEGNRAFDDIRQRLDVENGLISIYYHPCEFSTKGFWDGANFARGANPPRAEWKSPPLRSQTEMRDCLDLFSRYLSHIVSQPNVEVITGRQLLNLLPDRAQGRSCTPAEIARLADFQDGQITFKQLGDAVLAPSELFAMTVEMLASVALRKQLPEALTVSTPMGPTRRQASTIEPGSAIPVGAFLKTCADVADFLGVHGRLPDNAWIGVERLSPADFLLTATSLLQQFVKQSTLPDQVEVRQGELALEHHVRGRWGWVVFPEDFQADNITELGRLQAWTLKPALLEG
jgi:hypothetical protein